MSGRGAFRAAALTVALTLAAACSPDQATTPVPPSPAPQTQPSTASVQPPEPTVEGPGRTAPGIHLAAIPHSDGSFDITEDVVLRAEVALVRLRPPPSGEHLTGMMRATRPVVTNLRIVANGQPVRVPGTQLTGARDLPLPVAATRLRLTYRLSGSTVRNQPSQSGRAAAVISPLIAGVDGTLPTNYQISGSGLLNAVCPELAETRCAVGEPPGLGIQQGIPAGQSLAVLQLNLPTQA